MINRENYKIAKKYLAYVEEVLQRDPGTMNTYWSSIKSLLNYADERPFYELPKIKPTFPDYLRTVKTESRRNKGDNLSVKWQQRRLDYARRFFEWAKKNKIRGYNQIDELFLDTLRVRRSDLLAAQERQEHEFVTLDEVLQVARFSPRYLAEERARAAICFLYLSGMRVTAFCSLPADCVDIEARRIEQKPSRGVITKNRKAAVTFLLPVPELLEVVEAWDKKIRSAGCVDWCPGLIKKGSL